jgi:Plasmid pRiA4b ORF-3-like protein
MRDGLAECALHQFIIRGQRYGPPDEDDIGPRKTKDERKYKLSELVAGEGEQFIYEYDFGDNWQHTLEIEKVVAAEEGTRYPVCVAGARACPPEDVGGMPGYEDFLAAINDATHAEHEEYLDWIGGEFDPEAFDRDEVNRRLRAMR